MSSEAAITRFIATMILLGMLAPAALGQDTGISKDGIGPFIASMKIQVKGDNAQLHLSVRNGSGKIIEYARFCVLAPSKKEGCDFDLVTVRAWKPNEQLRWMDKAKVTTGIENSSITITDLKARTSTVPSTAFAAPTITEPKSNPTFQGVRKIFVEEIAGNDGPIVRDQLKASLANSRRFAAVDDPKLADAFIRGSADLRETGTASDTTGRKIVGGISVIAAGSTKGSTTTQTLTERIIAIHLSLPAGEILWGWDGSKACTETVETKCAIDDLVESTVIRPAPQPDKAKKKPR